jgi:hypothetical protein
LTRRPVWMREKTYKRLLQRYLDYDERWYEESMKEARAWFGVLWFNEIGHQK